MAVVIVLCTGAQVAHHDLFFWMERVLDGVRSSLDRAAADDLRVAIRRCCKFCQLLVTA
jgi:hypothetical protein